MHDDEVRARLGLDPLGRAMTMEERIAALNLRAMPEPHDPAIEASLELTDLTRGSLEPEGKVSFRRRVGNDALIDDRQESGGDHDRGD